MISRHFVSRLCLGLHYGNSEDVLSLIIFTAFYKNRSVYLHAIYILCKTRKRQTINAKQFPMPLGIQIHAEKEWL